MGRVFGIAGASASTLGGVGGESLSLLRSDTDAFVIRYPL